MDRDDPDLEKVRIKLDRIAEDEEISVVAIGDIDLSACSGVHVMETSELEYIIADRKVSAGKDGTAIHFKVGSQAKEAAAVLAVTALSVTDTMGCRLQDTARAVSNMKAEAELNRKLLKESTRIILSDPRKQTAGGTEIVSAIIPGGDRALMSEAAESVKSEGNVAVFVSSGESVSVMLASGNKSADCRVILSETLKRFGGRGGGKPDFAQGGVPSGDPGEIMDALRKAVSDALS